MGNSNAIITIRTEEKLCIELFANYKPLGRIALRSSAGTIGAGMVICLIS